jgi:hypothetical protein
MHIYICIYIYIYIAHYTPIPFDVENISGSKKYRSMNQQVDQFEIIKLQGLVVGQKAKKKLCVNWTHVLFFVTASPILRAIAPNAQLLVAFPSILANSNQPKTMRFWVHLPQIINSDS